MTSLLSIIVVIIKSEWLTDFIGLFIIIKSEWPYYYEK